MFDSKSGSLHEPEDGLVQPSNELGGILARGRIGETYVIGADGERPNIDSTGLRRKLGWEPKHTDFSVGLDQTITWYTEHEDWWRSAKDATGTRCAKAGQ